MNDLLQTALTAHGGLKRWNEIHTIKVAASITGAIWFVKSQGDYLKNIVMTVDTKKEKLVTDFPGQDKRFVFEPPELVMERLDGTMIDARDDPEQSFAGHQRETPWDGLHVAYFQGEALWTYLTTPFLLGLEGVDIAEMPRDLNVLAEQDATRVQRIRVPYRSGGVFNRAVGYAEVAVAVRELGG